MEKLENKEKLILKFKEFILVFWPYILTVALVVLPWFLKSGYIFLTDMAWGPNIVLDWSNSWFAFYLTVKILSMVFSIAFLQKMIFSGAFLLILLGGRALVRTTLMLMSERVASGGLVFVLSLFALLNPFVYDRALYGQLGVLLAYGLLLWTGAYLIIASFTFNWRYLCVSAIFSAIAMMFSVHFVFLFLLLYLLFFLSLLWRWKKIIAANQARKFWRVLIISVVLAVALNINWLFAIATGNSPVGATVGEKITTQDLFTFKTAGKTSSEVVSNVFLMSGFWGKDQKRYFDAANIKQNWGRSFLLLLPLILYGVIKGFRRRKDEPSLFYFTIGLLATYFVSFFLAMGVSTQFSSGITLWLFNNFPLYKGMREPQKWVSLIILVYLVFLTLGVHSFFKNNLVAKNNAFFKILLTLVIILQAPLLLWGLGGQALTANYPKDWYQANDYIGGAKDCNGKILFLPWHLYMGFTWIGHVVANPAQVFFKCPVINGTNMEAGVIYDNSGNPTGQRVHDWVFVRGMTDLFAVEQIKYVILAKEVDWTGYEWLNASLNLQLIQDSETIRLYKVIAE